MREEKKRAQELAIARAIQANAEAVKSYEEKYQRILNNMVAGDKEVSEEELKSLGKDAENLRQEAENKIESLPREEREVRLALIRGDKVSNKTFAEIK